MGLLPSDIETTVDNALHLAERPEWTCRVDGQPWPCPEAKKRLTAEFRNDLTGLRMYLAGHIHEIRTDLADQSPADLHRRLLGWV